MKFGVLEVFISYSVLCDLRQIHDLLIRHKHDSQTAKNIAVQSFKGQFYSSHPIQGKSIATSNIVSRGHCNETSGAHHSFFFGQLLCNHALCRPVLLPVIEATPGHWLLLPDLYTFRCNEIDRQYPRVIREVANQDRLRDEVPEKTR